MGLSASPSSRSMALRLSRSVPSRLSTLALSVLFSLTCVSHLVLASSPQSILALDFPSLPPPHTGPDPPPPSPQAQTQAQAQAQAQAHETHLLTSEILSAAHAARTAQTCAACRALLVPFQRLARLGDAPFVGAVVRLCKARRLADPDICEGDVGAQGPVIAHALRQISASGRTATLLCNALFGLCDLVPPEPYNMTFPGAPEGDESDRATAEAAEAASRLKRGERRKPFQVVHLSDVHIDRDYTVGSEANCTKYICCRDFSSSSSTSPLSVPKTEGHKNKDKNEDGEISDPAGPYGNIRCDSPISLADSMVHAINNLVPDALFTISSGDVVDHANWLLTQSVVEDELHSFHAQLLANLSESNTFYGSLGNHDTYPTNDFPRSTSGADNNITWLFDLMSAEWQPWIGDKGASYTRHMSGSYAVVHPGTKLKLISINSQYWYKFNFWLYDSDEFQPDPNGILEFLIAELAAAEKAGQRSWIFGHIPPGSSDVMRDQSNYYNQIVRRYHKTIAGQFYGHTHYDQFQVAYTNYSEPNMENAMSFGLVAPSLTPTNGNPAFTVYDVDPETYDIMDAKVYIANMSQPEYQNEPEWGLYYSARDSYGPLVASVHPSFEPSSSPLDASFWHALTEVFATNGTAFDVYRNRTVRDAPPPIGGRNCSDLCRNITICDMRAMRAEDSCFRQSLKDIDFPNKPDPNPGKFVFPELEAHEACEGSAIPSIMRRLLSASSD